MSSKPFIYCPLCATPLVQKKQMGEVRPTCPNCGWVHYEDPKVAAGVLAVENGRVLLVRRTMDPHAGQWSIPAGFVNAFEDPARAAVRECLEETGLQAEVEELFDLLTGRERSRGADIFLVYCVHIIGGDLCAADDADGAAWYLLDALPELAFNSTKKIFGKLLAG